MTKSSVSKPAAPLRTLILRITIGSFSLAALMGVLALLSGGEFGETEGRVLTTTLLVGVTSVLVLCYLATAGTAYQPVGVAGGVVVVVPLVTSLVLIWRDFDVDPPEALLDAFGVGTVAALTLAQACLLLALAADARAPVRHLLAATLGLAAVLAGLVSALVLGYEPSGTAFFRILGVVAILDVLGTVVVAALTRFGLAPRAPATAATPGAGEPGTLVVDPALAARLRARAEAAGRDPGDLLDEAVARYLDNGTALAPPTPATTPDDH